MNQRDVTCNTILAVLADRGVSYEENGPAPICEVLTADDKKKVREIVTATLLAGGMDFKDRSKLSDDKYVKDYVSGLVNNWIRKAPEFNGGEGYQPKNPGSRTGSSDEAICEMKKLLSATTDAAARAAIQEAISERLAAIAPKTEINMSVIPESLRAKLGL